MTSKPLPDRNVYQRERERLLKERVRDAAVIPSHEEPLSFEPITVMIVVYFTA